MSSGIIEVIRRDCNEVIENNEDSLLKLKNECLLITGGTGFMGTWLAELVAFLNDNYSFATRLILLSRDIRDFKARVSHLADRKDINFIEQDVRNLSELPAGVTMIINAAATPDSRMHASDPLKVMRVIANGLDNVLNAAGRLANLKRFLHISSGLVYGAQPLTLENIREDFLGGPDCNSISSIYAEAKRFSEALSSAYRSLYKINIVIARPFAFVGPYQFLDKPWAINNFIRDGLLGGPIRILGDGQTVRSYMYPSDMAFWLLRILIDGKEGLVYNVGSPQDISLRDLAYKVADNFSPASKIILSGYGTGAGQCSRFVPDVSLCQKSLKLEQKVGIDQAIRRTINWHRQTGIKNF